MNSNINITKKSADYELLDSGNAKKLERFGKYVLSRPDPEALWEKNLPESVWQNADAFFTRKGTTVSWKIKPEVPKFWVMDYEGLKFEIRPTSFKHVGLFPEQSENWKWMEKAIYGGKRQDLKGVQGLASGSRPKVLNLFGYTGGATLACARAGAEVTHVDGSKTAVAWARKNAELSGLSEKVIHWVIEDAMAFVKREVKRGNKYDAILMDPPSFGHGPKDELWKIEEHFLELMSLSKQLLSDTPVFFLINGYTAGYSPVAYMNSLLSIKDQHKGSIEIGELTIAETNSERLLPAGIFARWSK